MLTSQDLNAIKKIIWVGVEGRTKPLRDGISSIASEVSNIKSDLTDIKGKVDHLLDFAGRSEVRFMRLEDRLAGVENKVDLIPTKDEYFNMMDPMMGELKTVRQEQLSIHNRMNRIEYGKKKK